MIVKGSHQRHAIVRRNVSTVDLFLWISFTEIEIIMIVYVKEFVI